MKSARKNSEFRIRNQTKGTILAEKARVAETFVQRAKGLLGTDSLPNGEGLFIRPCNSIHMFGMRYAIDAVFVDRDLKVVAVLHSIKPGRMSRIYGRAHSCLELPAGMAKSSDTESGDRLELIEVNK